MATITLAGMQTGQVYLDVETLTFHTKNKAG